MPTLLRELRFQLGTRLQMRRAARELRAAALRASAAHDVVSAAFSTSGSQIDVTPLQVPSELERVIELVAESHPRRVLEIGTGSGGTLFALAWASARHAHILSIDRTVYPAERCLLYQSFVPARQIDVWEADSHLEETRDRVVRYFDDEPLDVVFIDGDHTYDSVRRDYELYAPLIREGGMLLFHDIVTGPYEAVGDVPRFWREVRPDLGDTVELVESWSQGGCGIGLGYAHGGPQSDTNRSSPSTSR